MQSMKKIVIVGATSCIAEHCARLWIKTSPVELTLVGRNKNHLQSIAADLQIRSPESAINSIQSDFINPSAIEQTVTSITTKGMPDIVLIAQGLLTDQKACQTDLTACRDMLEINGISPVLFAEAFITHLETAGRGTLALIGSVAGDRGRKSNYVYGSAKGLVDRYAQGLQHRFAGTQIKIVLIKPGPTDTPMTANLKAEGLKLASVEAVAKRTVDVINRGQAVIYVPSKWRFIMWIIKNLPNKIFNRLNI
jgi:decaprenylphospho-beta-D-erythro-pentofuranosid-2-ulose 2-reductase